MYHVSEFIDGDIGVIVDNHADLVRLMRAAAEHDTRWLSGAHPLDFAPRRIFNHEEIVVFCDDGILTYSSSPSPTGLGKYGREVSLHCVCFDKKSELHDSPVDSHSLLKLLEGF